MSGAKPHFTGYQISTETAAKSDRTGNLRARLDLSRTCYLEALRPTRDKRPSGNTPSLDDGREGAIGAVSQLAYEGGAGTRICNLKFWTFTATET